MFGAMPLAKRSLAVCPWGGSREWGKSFVPSLKLGFADLQTAFTLVVSPLPLAVAALID